MRERVQRARKKELTRRAVRPPEEGVEDAPALAVELVFRVAAVEVPHAAAHVERARAVPACVVHVCAEPVIRSDFADPGGGRQHWFRRRGFHICTYAYCCVRRAIYELGLASVHVWRRDRAE